MHFGKGKFMINKKTAPVRGIWDYLYPRSRDTGTRG